MHYSAVLPTLLLAIGHSALAGQIFNVTVGGVGGTITFTPNTVTANIGDTVRFEFHQKNHTATQSSFNAPCVPLPGGFDSGFQPVPDTQTSNFNAAELAITDTNPVWVFCRQANHCQQGMVFAVNPGDQFTAFQSAAASAPFGTTTTASTASATATSTTVTAPAGSITATTTGTTTAATSTATGTNHLIIVGGPNIIAFSPSNISALLFHQKNHTATASAFDTPCRALSSTSTTGQLGFDSGFIPVDANVTSNFPTFTITVNDTNPIWAYCRQATHCGQGMVFAANAVESGPKNFTAFQALAKQQNGTTTPASSAQAAHALSYSPVLLAVLAIAFLA
ncbi:Cupredoxin [Pholiota molesta]|nr:Cupredoxin [Pholiota molesta]